MPVLFVPSYLTVIFKIEIGLSLNTEFQGGKEITSHSWDVAPVSIRAVILIQDIFSAYLENSPNIFQVKGIVGRRIPYPIISSPVLTIFRTIVFLREITVHRRLKTHAFMHIVKGCLIAQRPDEGQIATPVIGCPCVIKRSFPMQVV